MSNFIDRHIRRYTRRVAEIRRMDQAVNRQLQAEEDAAVDAEHEEDIARRKAIVEREETLGVAFLVANQMNAAHVTPEVWQHSEDDVQEKGILFFKRPRVVGRKTVVAAMGWPLITWTDRVYDAHEGSVYLYDYLVHNHLLLGTDGNIMAVLKRADHGQFEPAKPLGRVPIEDDPVTWLKKEQDYPPEEGIFEIGKDNVRDLDDYKRAGIENRLRDALARLAAENINPDGTRRISRPKDETGFESLSYRRDLTDDSLKRSPLGQDW